VFYKLTLVHTAIGISQILVILYVIITVGWLGYLGAIVVDSKLCFRSVCCVAVPALIEFKNFQNSMSFRLANLRLKL
jgi:hypothetical protein